MTNETASEAECGREVLAEEPGRVILGIISQLRRGMDLHKITLPTFVLEPRSMCERILDIMSNVDLVSGTADKEDPMERFIDVVRYFLAGWHLRPKGVKKPYNPILGEFFRCECISENNSKCIYVCEQVSHHPPASTYFFSCPESDVHVQGEVWPKSTFLGNSIAMKMGGVTRLHFPNKRPGEEYLITLPTMYAHGILFGSMYLELGDTVTVKCPKTNILAEIQFQKKGIFTGGLNEIRGKIKEGSSKAVRYTLCGNWTQSCYIVPHSKDNPKNCEKHLLFDTSELTPLRKIVPNLAEQSEFESRALWKNVTKSLLRGDLDSATFYKENIEENQRKLAKRREAQRITWSPRYFKYDNDAWTFNLDYIPTDPAQALSVINSRVFSPPTLDIHKSFWIIPPDDNPKKKK